MCPSLHLGVVQRVREAEVGVGLMTVAVMIDAGRAL
jgi:hypothetical protein